MLIRNHCRKLLPVKKKHLALLRIPWGQTQGLAGDAWDLEPNPALFQSCGIK